MEPGPSGHIHKTLQSLRLGDRGRRGIKVGRARGSENLKGDCLLVTSETIHIKPYEHELNKNGHDRYTKLDGETPVRLRFTQRTVGD